MWVETKRPINRRIMRKILCMCVSVCVCLCVISHPHLCWLMNDSVKNNLWLKEGPDMVRNSYIFNTKKECRECDNLLIRWLKICSEILRGWFPFRETSLHSYIITWFVRTKEGSTSYVRSPLVSVSSLIVRSRTS